MYLAMLFV